MAEPNNLVDTQSTAATGGPIQEFVNAFNQGKPLKMVEIQSAHNMNIPAEFDNLGKATSQIRNLIFTHNLLKEGQIDQADWEHYIDTVWLKKKAQQDFNEMDTSKVYKGANGATMYLVKKGPDAGRFWVPAEERSVNKADDSAYFPARQTSVGTGDQAANTEYLKGISKKAAAFSETMTTQISAAAGIKRDAGQAVQILEAYPQVAGVFNIDEVNDTVADAIAKSAFSLLQTGIATPWGQLSIDLAGFWQNLLLDTDSKDQLSKLEAVLSKLGTSARAELAGQGTITDAEAEAVAKQFGSINQGASSLMASLKLAIWRADLTVKQGKLWTQYEADALAKDSAPRVSKFLTETWLPVMESEIANLDVIALGQIQAEEASDTSEPVLNEDGSVTVGNQSFKSKKVIQTILNAPARFDAERVEAAKLALDAFNAAGYANGGLIAGKQAMSKQPGGLIAR